MKATLLSPPPDAPFITLELSAIEADTLTTLLLNVGGSPGKTRRGVTDGMLNPLRKLGLLQRARQSMTDFEGDFIFK